MHQVLMNLIVNARDAMPRGGRVTIETRNVQLTETDRKDGSEVTPGNYVLLEVRDTGIGMDPEVQARIFEPFFTTKELGQGTGLGLSTVYGIVKQSKGWITVESEPRQGTTFQIYLPGVDAGMPAETVPLQDAADLGGPETVLVVEDQAEVRKLTVEVLKSYGYKVLEAAHGEEALSLVARNEGPIDLMVTDVVMPGMMGNELAELLRSVEPQMRVLYTSGYGESVIAQRGVLAPGVEYLAKPFSPETLAAKVREVMGD